MWYHASLPDTGEEATGIEERFSRLYAQLKSPAGMMLLGRRAARGIDFYLALPASAPTAPFAEFTPIGEGQIPNDARLLLGTARDYEGFLAIHRGGA